MDSSLLQTTLDYKSPQSCFSKILVPKMSLNRARCSSMRKQDKSKKAVGIHTHAHTHTHTHTHTQVEEETVSPWSFPHWFVVTLKFVYSSGESLGYGFEQHPNKTARGLSKLFSKEMTLWFIMFSSRSVIK